MFAPRQRRTFSGRSARNQEVYATANLALDQLSQRSLIERKI
jgi:hypothetical protein